MARARRLSASESANRPVGGGESVSLKAPFPWFGGKSRAAHLIWERFGARFDDGGMGDRKLSLCLTLSNARYMRNG